MGGGIGEECLSAVGTGPSRRRVGLRDELGRDIGRSAKGRIVEHSYIFFDRPADRFWWQPLLRSIPFCRLASAFDQTGIDRKGFPPTGPSGMPRPQDCLEDALPPQAEVSFWGTDGEFRKV